MYRSTPPFQNSTMNFYRTILPVYVILQYIPRIIRVYLKGRNNFPVVGISDIPPGCVHLGGSRQVEEDSDERSENAFSSRTRFRNYSRTASNSHEVTPCYSAAFQRL